MKKVLIYDCAAESGGALTVLRDYYKRYANKADTLTYFLVSIPDLCETEHCKVIKVPWIKKSRIHRLIFDTFYVQKIVNDLQPDEVISLQNIGISRIHCRQTVFVHNAIPFCNENFSLFKDRRLWVYKNIIGFFTYRSLKKVDKIIVQTDWMKKAVCAKCGIDPNIIQIERMFSQFEEDHARIYTKTCHFFYPATSMPYKNHRVILNACIRLKKAGISDYKVFFTFKDGDPGQASEYCKFIYNNHLPVFLLGNLDKEQMIRMYKSSILVFPSFIETIGLPLKEAQSFNTLILACDCLYSREAIGEYPHSKFFTKDDDELLFEYMKEEIISFNNHNNIQNN